MTQPTVPPPGATPPRTVRLIFSYEDDTVRLVLQQPVDVAVTGFDVDPVPRSGHYVEVRTAEGRALTRVRVHGGIPTSAEVFGEPGTPISRVDLERVQGAFTVVVPAPEEAARIALVQVEAVPPAGATPGGPALAPSERVTELLDVALER